MASYLDQGSIENFAEIAGFYSQLAGVLAGFAFAGLIALIASQLTMGVGVGRCSSHSYRPLLAAFLGLVATSLNYAIVAGDQATTQRILELETTAGLGFGVAGTMLLYSILVLLRGVDTDLHGETGRGATSKLLAGTLILGIPTLIIVLLYGAINDHLTTQPTERNLHWLDIAVAIAIIVSLFVGSILMRRTWSPSGERWVSALSRVAIGISLASVAVTSLLLSFMEPTDALPDFVPMTVLIVFTTFSMAVAYSTATYKPSKEPASRPIAEDNDDSSEGSTVSDAGQSVKLTTAP